MRTRTLCTAEPQFSRCVTEQNEEEHCLLGARPSAVPAWKGLTDPGKHVLRTSGVQPNTEVIGAGHRLGARADLSSATRHQGSWDRLCGGRPRGCSSFPFSLFGCRDRNGVLRVRVHYPDSVRTAWLNDGHCATWGSRA